MKIVIEKDTSIKIATERLSKFLIENYSEYPIVKNTMNIYVTLKNSDGRICPDNEKEYILTKNHVKDIFEEEKHLALDERLLEWNSLLNTHKWKISSLEKKISADENYLATAEEKNRKKENIEMRKKQYEKNKQALDDRNKLFVILEFLDDTINSGHFIIFYIKNTYRSTYKYDLNAVFIFDNINGYSYYFDWHGLHNGLPDYYKHD